MPDLSLLVFHPLTKLALNGFVERPGHALLLTGLPGSGKATTAQFVAAKLLRISANAHATDLEHPYVRIIRPVDNKAISIETIRGIQQFLRLRVPGSKADNIARAIIIEDAQLLTIEAQNALLKTLEEPPNDTVLILTATSIDAVLPTIQSRIQKLAVLPPAADELNAYFSNAGFKSADVQRALMLSGELPGLATALLTKDMEHPLVAATTHARGILQSKTYERLLLVDGLSKQRDLCLNILYILGQMSRMALLKASDPKAAARWRTVMASTYQATERLQRNTQTKLVMTHFMLSL